MKKKLPVQRKKVRVKTASVKSDKTRNADKSDDENGDRIIKAKGKEVKLTNLQKVYWPGEGITKGDVISYYQRMSEYILPYLQNRPQSLNRHPNGIKAPGFYQKDMDVARSYLPGQKRQKYFLNQIMST